MKRQMHIRLFTSLLVFAWVFGVGPQIFNFPLGVKVARAAVPVVEGFQATSRGTDTFNSITLTAPSGITAGELLLIIVANDDTSNIQQFTDNVSGWSLIGESGNDTADVDIAAYLR